MDSPLRVLIVEDSADDADLLLRELRRANYTLQARRVETAEELGAALDEAGWDLILSDHTLPKFSGTRALSLVRERGQDIPFIFVSGTIGEDVAVAAMQAGAKDYVTKGNLKRLVPAIDRELRDATMRREGARAESERRAAEQKRRQLFQAVEQSGNLVVITDAQGVIEYANPRLLEALGYAADEVVHRKPSLWKSGTMDARVYENLWQTIAAGQVWRGELQNRRRDGGLVTVAATISPVRDDEGRITHYVSIQEDVTYRREIEEQLRRSQRLEAIGQLTGGLAHDFNNLLTVVIGNLDLLHEEPSLPAEAHELVDHALTASLRGADLTRQLLAFARRQSLAGRSFDLNEMVSGTTALLRRTLGEQIDIKLKLADNLWSAVADPTQVESALANLALNARDAMSAGGRLTIETANARLDAQYAAGNFDATPGDYVMLAVSDTGSGIAPELIGRVIEPFFTTKPQGKGTGLGLSMVYGFAKQSGGHLKIQSEVGRGTTIRLYLPRADAGSVEAVHLAAAPLAAAAHSATILVVEDKADVRATVARQLRELGYRVMEAADAETAWDILRGDAPVDLLFTDVVMPASVSGEDVAREATRLRPGLKVLFTSGFTDAVDAGEAPTGRMYGVLSKPYRKQDLARRIGDALGA
ncbi:MAG: response regulator [Alphaproteobacteria bacterium]|nr:response regulator [Alphaproteobacteria bacterium]